MNELGSPSSPGTTHPRARMSLNPEILFFPPPDKMFIPTRLPATAVIFLLASGCSPSTEHQQRYMADVCAAYYDLRYQEGVMLKREEGMREMHARANLACDVMGFGQVIEAKVYKP